MPKLSGSVNQTTIQKLREQYKKTWGREWPHDDEHLKTLWNETPRSTLAESRYAETLMRMREDHEFEEPSNERLAQAFNDSGVFAPFTCIGK